MYLWKNIAEIDQKYNFCHKKPVILEFKVIVFREKETCILFPCALTFTEENKK